MRKLILALVLMTGMVCAANAQVDGKAIGVRFGLGGELSYQHPLGSANRLEADLGISGWGVGLTGIYQWVWDLSALADGFNWYAGVGGTLGLATSNSGFGLGVAGQVGIEYNFNIPLQLSLDYRPALYVLPVVYGGYDGICLAVRYKF